MSRRQRTFIGPQGMGGLVSMWGAKSLVQSVQRGSTTVASGSAGTNTAITQVDLANSLIVWTGVTFGSNNIAWASATGYLRLTSNVQVTVNRTGSAGAGSLVTYWEVIEFVPGVIKQVQRSTVTSGGTTAITAVNTAKSQVFYLGWSCADVSVGANQVVETPRISLDSATSVSCADGNGDANSTVSFAVVEFY